MKKTLIIIIAVVLVILIAVSGIIAGIFLFGGKEEPETTPTNDAGLTHMELLKLDTFSQLEAYVQQNDLVMQTSDDPGLTSIGGVPVAGHYMTLYFQADENGDIYRVDGIYDYQLENRELSTLKTELKKISDAIDQFFEVEESIGYTIYAADGYEIDSASDESFQKIIDGQASYSLFNIDTDESYWAADITVDEADRLSISFFHSNDFVEVEIEPEEDTVPETSEGTEDVTE